MKKIFFKLINSIVFWTISFIIIAIVSWFNVPFLLGGKLFISSLLLLIYLIILLYLNQSNYYNLDISLILFIGILIISMVCFVYKITNLNNIDKNYWYKVKNVECHIPLEIKRNNNSIILIDSNQVVISNDIMVYTNKNPYICKIEYYNAFKKTTTPIYKPGL